MSLHGRDVVCVGFSDWDAQIQTTQHHLIRRLAQDNQVLFVESLGLRRPQLAGGDIRRIWRRLMRGLRPVSKTEGVYVLSPLVIPLHTNKLVRAINRWLLRRFVSRAVRRLSMRNPILWSFVPQADTLLDTLRPSQVLYYVTDDHASKPGIDAASFRAAEEHFAARADVVFATAPELVARMLALNEDVHYAPAVADTTLFATTLDPGPVDDAVQALRSPRIVFIGAILAATLDIELICQVARLQPGWSFVFVGPVGQGDPGTNIDPLRQEPNIHLLGGRTQRELPNVLRGANATMIPYRTGEQMRSVFPMKTFEYLASGRPVVATALDALDGIPDVRVARTATEFSDLLEQELRDDSEQTRLERSIRVRSRSWESRLEEIACALSDAESSTVNE